MPVVIIENWEGPTVDQKRALVADIAAAMQRHLGTRPENLHIIFHDSKRENWGRGGVLASDL